MQMSEFSQLPTEIIERILLNLRIDDIKHFCSTNIRASQICNANDVFWKSLVKRDFGDVDFNRMYASYKYFYQQLKTPIYVVEIESFTQSFIKLNDAIDYFFNVIDHTKLFHITHINIRNIVSTYNLDVDEDFILRVINHLDLEFIIKDSDRVRQFNLLRNAIIQQIRSEIINSSKSYNWNYKLYTINREQFSISSTLISFPTKTQCEQKYDFIEIINGIVKTSHFFQCTLKECFEHISSQDSMFEIHNKTIKFESRTHRFIDESINDQLIEMIRKHLSHRIIM